MSFIVEIDMSLMSRDVASVNRGVAAVRETLRNAGMGQVVVSKRTPRRPTDPKGRVLHGRAIANIFADRGKDPFAFPQSVEEKAQSIAVRHATRALEVAYDTARPQRRRMQQGLRFAANTLATWARLNIRKGGLGQKKIRQSSARNRSGAERSLTQRRSATIGLWRRYVRTGKWTDRYGFPPPYGIASGRFLRGIRAIWKLGGRTRSTVAEVRP